MGGLALADSLPAQIWLSAGPYPYGQFEKEGRPEHKRPEVSLDLACMAGSVTSNRSFICDDAGN